MYVNISKCSVAFAIAILCISCQPIQASTIVEDFSGSGAFSSSSGQPGFELPDWINTGNPGTFSTNSFGESVYGLNSNDSLDGIYRYSGSDPFVTTAEFSNPSLSNTSSLFGLRVNDPGPANAVLALTVLPFSGNYLVTMDARVNNIDISGGSLSLGQATRTSLRLEYEVDPVFGGSMFTAWADTDESGNFQLIGTISGFDYSIGPSDFRNIFLATQSITFGHPADVEIDRFSQTTIPEPSGIAICGAALLACSCVRRKLFFAG